jgi:hypothetical protein
MNATFRTVVFDVPPTPLGLLPARVVIEHWCNSCHQRVALDDLVAHARADDARSGHPASVRSVWQGGDAIE